MGEHQFGDAEDVLRKTGAADEGAEGGGGAAGDESFTLGGPRGRDAERDEYHEPRDEDDDD